MSQNSTNTTTEDINVRLPRNVEPVHYDVRLAPDLVKAEFSGQVLVTLKVLTATDRIVLNAAELDIESANLIGKSGTTHVGAPHLNEELERLVVTLPHLVAPGEWTLKVTFSGALNDKLHGFYRSTFQDAGGQEQIIATTQFEATDARRAFPCWDEPDRKATFQISLEIDPRLAAFSNSNIERTEDIGPSTRLVVFEKTIRMSTYLVAFVVGPLVATDPVDVDGVALRVVHVPGKEDLTQFALEVGAHSLRFFSNWFDIAYPGDKIDLIALPDFAFGAMENFGAVTFRETALLADPKFASRVEMERVADVVCHEMAHMWFGDMVTMKWWNGLWLNEAFATFAGMSAVDAFRPSWNRWVTFGLSKGTAMEVDALSCTRPIEFPVLRPEDAQGMFDVLTYEKGAGVLRMLEQYLGPEVFIEGIRSYLKSAMFGNAETTDLWDAIEEASGQPVRSIMDSWIFQGGYPLVSASVGSTGSKVRLTQEPFRSLPSKKGSEGDSIGSDWKVPVVVSTVDPSGPTTSDKETHKVLLQQSAEIDLGAGLPDGGQGAVIVNAGGWGFYRVSYGPELRDRLVGSLDRLAPLERFNLVSDTWALVLAGETGADSLLDLMIEFKGDDDPNVWSQISAALAMLDHVAQGDAREPLQEFVRQLILPELGRIGTLPSPREDQQIGTLRSVLFKVAGAIGRDPSISEMAAHLHSEYVVDRSKVPPDLAGAVVTVLASNGGPAEYEAFVERYRSPQDPQEEIRYLYSLVRFTDPELFKKTLEMTRTEIRTQNAPFVIQQSLASLTGGAKAWDFVVTHWDELLGRFPDGMIPRMLDTVSYLCKPELGAQVRLFCDQHSLKAGQRTLNQALERLDMNIRFYVDQESKLEKSLKSALSKFETPPGSSGRAAKT